MSTGAENLGESVVSTYSGASLAALADELGYERIYIIHGITQSFGEWIRVEAALKFALETDPQSKSDMEK